MVKKTITQEKSESSKSVFVCQSKGQQYIPVNLVNNDIFLYRSVNFYVLRQSKGKPMKNIFFPCILCETIMIVSKADLNVLNVTFILLESS